MPQTGTDGPARVPPRSVAAVRTVRHLRSSPWAPYALVGVGVVAVSTSSILVRYAQSATEELSFNVALAFWRCFLGALAMLPFALRARRRAAAMDRLQRRQLLAAGVLLAAHFALFITALSFTTVASASVLVTMAPLFVGAGAALFLSEPPNRRSWVGIGVSLAGAALIGIGDLSGADLGPQALLGDGMAFAAAALVAGYLLIGRAARRRLPVSVYSTGVFGIAAAVLLPVCLLIDAPLGVGAGQYPATTWWAIAGLVVGPQLLGHAVFNTVLGTLSATVVAVAVLAEPVGSTVMAAVLLQELPAPLFYLGAPVILVGVYVTATSGRT